MTFLDETARLDNEPTINTTLVSKTAVLKPTLAADPERESFGAQAPLAMLALAVIAVIALINANARTPAAPTPIVAMACSSCGTVVAIRRSAHSAPVYFVEVQMLDGSTRVIQQLSAGFKIGDIVQVNGNALTLRPEST